MQDLGDTRIGEAVKRKLRRNGDVPADRVNVLLADGIATLSGTVGNLLEHKRAIETVESIRGVRAVVDEIQVVAEPRPDPEIGEDVAKALRADSAVPAGNLEVRVDRGIVALSGELPSRGLKQLAQEAIESIPGIRCIQNSIEVKPQEVRPDVEIKNEVTELLAASVRLDERLINVEVHDGKVILRGAVGSLGQQTCVRNLAWVPGVKDLDDSNLGVSPWIQTDLEDPDPYRIRTEEEVAKAAKDVLRHDARVPEFDIDVEIANEKAVVNGVVDDFRTKRAALRDLHEVIGISHVEDRITVKPAEAMDDSELESAIAAAILRDPVLGGLDLSVAVENGAVTLEGTAHSHFAYDRTTEIAAAMRGVRDIRNELKVVVEPPEDSADDLRRDIEHELFWNPLVGSSAITVQVEDRTAILTGNVANSHEKQIATTSALTAGARKVNNRISVGAS